MAQSSNLQREPSMEEILASIRRIIEDSDVTRKSPDDVYEAPEEAAEPVEANNVHAFRLDLNGAPEKAVEQPEPVASFYDAPERSYGSAPERSETEASPDPDKVDDRLQAEPPPRDEIEMELSLHDFPEAPTDAEARTEDTIDIASEASAPLTSDHTGRQVAASFVELGAAFEARSRRSFDQIAEEMMRPMLQDWLDNNLPHLVERLVREEIERIARGAAAPR